MANRRSAYTKRNTSYPISRDGSGWRQVTLEERYEAGVAHFLETPKGSLYRDKDYGTELYKLRGQTMNDPRDEEQLVKADLQRGFARYFPDLSLREVSIVQDHSNETRYCAVVWIVRGADRHIHGDLAKPRKTQVAI